MPAIACIRVDQRLGDHARLSPANNYVRAAIFICGTVGQLMIEGATEDELQLVVDAINAPGRRIAQEAEILRTKIEEPADELASG